MWVGHLFSAAVLYICLAGTIYCIYTCLTSLTGKEEYWQADLVIIGFCLVYLSYLWNKPEILGLLYGEGGPLRNSSSLGFIAWLVQIFDIGYAYFGQVFGVLELESEVLRLKNPLANH